MTECNWIVKAFHTGGPYTKDAVKLRASAERFGIPINIEAIKSRGSWNLNTHYKPLSILAAMDKHLGREYIIHVDADAWFMQYPTLFDDLDCDIGLFYWKNGKTWCSGTVIVKNCKAMKDFMNEWDAALRKDPKQRGDQVALGRLIDASSNLNIVNIPPGYIQGLAPGLKKGEGVIAHDGARKRYVGTRIYTNPK
jgi:hypothetical protein